MLVVKLSINSFYTKKWMGDYALPKLLTRELAYWESKKWILQRMDEMKNDTTKKEDKTRWFVASVLIATHDNN